MNLDSQTREAIKSGNLTILKETLIDQREKLRDFLEDCSESKFKETQGKCKTLSQLIKLLP